MRILLASVVALGLALPVAAQAQVESREAIALQNQMLELRREVQNLREQVGRGQPAQSGGSVVGGRTSPQTGGGEITVQLLDRVTAMEEAIRRLNGRIDEVDFARQRADADLAKQIADLTFRLDNPGTAAPARPAAVGAPIPPAGGTLSPPAGTLGTVPAGPPTAPVRRTPELALQEGNAALGRRDYAAAEAAAREVLANGKGSPRAYDAQFLLAQALSGNRKATEAAIAYGDTFNAAKQGSHAQDALVGYATNLTVIGEKKAACDTLDILRAQFPTPRADIAAKAVTARQAAGCR